MPRLQESLAGKDLGHLKIVAECWGLAIEGKNVRQSIDALSASMLNQALLEEIIATLPEQARAALQRMARHGGKMDWGQFEREIGALRNFGPAQRDKQQPQRAPTSTAEILWYRALVARAFFDTDNGPREFAYIPSDLMALIPGISPVEHQIFGRLAHPAEKETVKEANDHILDEAVSFLAGLRMGLDEAALAEIEEWQIPVKVLRGLLIALGVLNSAGAAQSEAIQHFLTIERAAAMPLLLDKWRASADFNELRLLPGLRAEGQWTNDAVQSRQRLLALLRSSAKNEWWSIRAFIDDVKTHYPDFLRKGGEYESWYFKDLDQDEFVRGFAQWVRIEGAYLRWMIAGPLHWLGLLDLAYAADGQKATAFRFSPMASALLDGEKPLSLAVEEGQITVDSQGQIQVPASFPRALRYQLARFCEWEGRKKGSYRYQIRAATLERAKAQGLEVSHLLSLLQKHANSKIPPNLLKALKGWQQEGTIAKAGEMLVLRVRSKAVLQALQKSRAKRYLGEPLGPYAVEIKAGARRNVLQALTELGYLAEIEAADDA